MPPVGADDHPGVGGDGLAVPAAASDPADAPVGDHHLGDGEAVADLGPCSAAASTSSLSSTVRRGP
jgi:hypothetical protein